MKKNYNYDMDCRNNILYLNLEEVGALRVPIIDTNVQRQIADLIGESFSLRRESERLLVEARGMVEGAVK